MGFTDIQTAALSAKLDKSVVRKNPKGFDYVEAWHAIAEANRIFGYDGWDRHTVDMVQLGEPEQVNGNWRVAYRCRVRIEVRAGGVIVTRDGTGYGSGIVKDVRDAHESACKEAESDAMKRALMTFGNPFGLALYDKAQANVETPPRVDPKRAKAELFVKQVEDMVGGGVDAHELSAMTLDGFAGTVAETAVTIGRLFPDIKDRLAKVGF